MKVILREEVSNLGDIGDTVNVAPGYARNFLIPRNLAVTTESGSAKELQHIKRMVERREEKRRKELGDVRGTIHGTEIVFTLKAGEEGKLYGSVTTAQIGERLAELGHDVDRRKIHVEEAIKTVGEHTATLVLATGIEADLKIIVQAEDVEEEDGKAEAAKKPETPEAPADTDADTAGTPESAESSETAS